MLIRSIGYDVIIASVVHGSDMIVATSLSLLYQKIGDVTDLKARIVTTGFYVGEDVITMIRSVTGKGNRVVRFGARVYSIVGRLGSRVGISRM